MRNFNAKIPVQFDHYGIRPLQPEDIDAYFKLVEKNRPRLEDYFTGTISRTKTYEDAQAFVTEMVQRREERSYFPHLIINTSTQELIGFLDLKNLDWRVPKSELGLYMDEDYAGKGIGTKALHSFCEFCFAHYKFKKLFLRTHEDNTAMRAIAEKCGFQKEGLLRREYKTTSGELIDLVYYGKII